MKKKPRQMTVNFVLKIKGCTQDFGLGPGVISKQKSVYKDERGRGFDSPLLQMGFAEVKEQMVDGTLEFQALVTRPPAELKGKGRKSK